MGVNRVTIKKADVNVSALLLALTFAKDVKVGYPGETTGPVRHGDSEVPMASLAAFAELGTENSPPRRFMTQGASILVERRGLLTPHVMRLVSGKSHVDGFMITVGKMLKSSIEAAVARQDFAPLAPATVAAKGSSEILVDTGEMVDSLDVHLDRL